MISNACRLARMLLCSGVMDKGKTGMTPNKRIVWSLLAAAAVSTAASSSHAVTAHGQQSQGILELAHAGPLAAAEARALRLTRSDVPRSKRNVYQRFLNDVGGRWVASWDDASLVPLRIFGSGVAVPGSVAQPHTAEQFAQSMLQRHIALLAPGAQPTDFVLVANVEHQGMRVVGFKQMHKGMAVRGGKLSFRFKNDALFVIASEALPDVAGRGPGAAMVSDAVARKMAEQWLIQDAAVVRASEVSAPMVLPVLHHGKRPGYHVVREVLVQAEQPIGKWLVYVDARTGKAIAREQTLRFAEGSVRFRVPDRYPEAGYIDALATNAYTLVDGQPATTSALGTLTLDKDNSNEVTLRAAGPRVTVDNKAGSEVTVNYKTETSKDYLWDATDKTLQLAQLSSFIGTEVAKTTALRLAPTMSWANQNFQVNVNINDQCNAFYDGKSINFYQASNQCQNTALLSDVISHEYGHGFHHRSLIGGAGTFDSALSEGASDFFASTISDDPAMGRGFFYGSKPLRHIDPEGGEYVWPQDIGQDPHQTGLIIGGTLWDLRKLLIAKYGEDEGKKVTESLFSQALKTASDIPSMYPDMLAADDDNGNLSDGTPNACEIIEAFGSHGLRTINVVSEGLGAEPPTQDGYEVSVSVSGLFSDCSNDAVKEASLRWRLRRTPNQNNKVAMIGADSTFIGTIPSQDSGEVINYQVEIRMAEGNQMSFPDNLADRYYEFFVGDTKTLYCTDFETDPLAEGWTHGLLAGTPSEGADDWQWGIPQGTPINGDPPTAFSGAKVLGNDLGSGNYNGLYQGDKVNYAASPVIDTAGFSNVRVQYRRWLNVEDGFFDRAEVLANDKVAWSNYASQFEDDADTHHTDKEWRFHDLDVSEYIGDDGKLQVTFKLSSDQGMHLGGWNVDDFCVVAYEGEVPSAPSCGNGKVELGEDCDDGNFVAGDGCDSFCAKEAADQIPSGPELPAEPTVVSGGCGCVVTPASAPVDWRLLASAALGLALAARRRRRDIVSSKTR